MSDREELARFIVENLSTEDSSADGGYIRAQGRYGDWQLDDVVIDGHFDLLNLADKIIATQSSSAHEVRAVSLAQDESNLR